eukprot:TRINITY_DN11020_c0_g2_i5.p1 TRINITY_DN11020_c0_g2~~TRINITY_DN11020_c0_g2_i5.p1  ORF type:complete len:172 (+),score=54.33 TRINITY_DN11020_c0_g2_i5:281-796(+)
MPAMYDDTVNDQLMWTHVFLANQEMIKLDYHCELFQNLFGTLRYDEDLEWKGGKWFNKHTGKSPSFFHGNGPLKNKVMLEQVEYKHMTGCDLSPPLPMIYEKQYQILLTTVTAKEATLMDGLWWVFLWMLFSWRNLPAQIPPIIPRKLWLPWVKVMVVMVVVFLFFVLTWK